MGRFDATKATIDANIKSNGNQEITGDILNSVMKDMVDATDAELTQLSAEIDEVKVGLGVYDIVEGYYTSSTGKAVYNPGGAWSVRFKVKEGDKIQIHKADGGGGIRQWVFIDDTLNVISRSEENAKSAVLLTTPTGATQAIIQSITGANISFDYGITQKIEETNTDIDTINADIDTIKISMGEYENVKGYYLYENGVAKFFEDVNGPNKSIRFKVNEGDKIDIKQANGGGGVRLWMFVDNNMNVISRSDANINAPISIIAPTGATQVIVQSTSKEIILAYGITQKIEETNTEIDGVANELKKQLEGGVIEETVTDFTNKGVWLYGNDVLESAQYNVTKYIIIDSATEIVLNNVWVSTGELLGYAIYDAKKKLLASNPTPSATGLQNYTLTSADLPDGAMYLRATQNTLHEASVRVISDYKGVKNEIAELKSGGGQLSSSAYIALPVPELAMVNIISKTLPETKTADIEAVMEFNDMQGNIIKKNIIINAQGNSTLGHAKKNFGVDIVDSKYDESHSLKFGNWVAQDSFHWKAYMLDQTRVKAMAAYDFYESILLTRGMRKDRSWKRLQLPTDIPTASGSVTGEYLAMDSGAKCHPVGFPFILLHNGSFYGIYCWQLKKHRDNYHQKKSKAEHIHLDGNISKTLLWNANGVIDWAKWSGLVDESAESPNRDGIEIRNPKNLILVDGSKYDGDDNRGELISTTSAKYDASNEDMVMTAKVRQSLELFSRNVYNLQQMSKGAEKKAEIAKVFDVESIIDFIIFGQITGNVDGYKKNWQWNTYDGVKWAVNAYDLDAVWGWGGSSYYEPSATFIGTYAPPVAMVVENYLDEIKARYAELRDKGVITTEQVLKPLYNYVRIIGADYYEQEYAKWSFGNADNLWRFEEWVAEAIRLTDILMDYNL